jgi:RsiW-degrading membrane proteinase PrsW (M82 family)
VNTAQSHAYAASRRGRYLAAGVVAGLVLLVLVFSSVLDYATLSAIPARVAIFGLSATVLLAGASYIGVRAFDREPSARRRHLLRAGLLLAAATLLWLLILDTFLFTQEAGPAAAAICALACLPTTAFGLWFVRRVDRYEPEPWRLILLAAVWGAIVATSLVVWAEGLWEQASFAFLVPGPGLEASIAFSAGFFEELSKGTAVLLLFLVMRDRFDDVVDGIVYGAAVGLGFNFLESIAYMTNLYSIFGADMGIGAAGVQWYSRQVLGLFFGHATYTALIGAGIGIARQVAGRRQVVVAILCGWLAAIAAHFAWDAWLSFFPISQSYFGIIEVHLRTLIMNGPFTAAIAVLLVMGLARESQALRRQVESEAQSGRGAIVAAEVPILLSPWRRLLARAQAFESHGLGAYRQALRIQRAQLELVMQRWHRERREIDAPPELEEQLRARVLSLKMPPEARPLSPR